MQLVSCLKYANLFDKMEEYSYFKYYLKLVYNEKSNRD